MSVAITSDGAVHKELVTSNSSDLKIETKLEVQKKEETNKLEKKEDRQKRPAVKPRPFDGSTPVKAFLQQFRACTQYGRRRRAVWK